MDSGHLLAELLTLKAVGGHPAVRDHKNCVQDRKNGAHIEKPVNDQVHSGPEFVDHAPEFPLALHWRDGTEQEQDENKPKYNDCDFGGHSITLPSIRAVPVVDALGLTGHVAGVAVPRALPALYALHLLTEHTDSI